MIGRGSGPRRRATAVAAAIAAAAVAVPAAGAQTQPLIDSVGDWASSQELRRLLPDAERVGKRAKGTPSPRAQKPTARQLATLRFTRDAEVTQRNYQAVIDTLGPEYVPERVRSEFDRLRGLSHANMRGLGWRANDVGDVAAYELLLAFAAWHPQEASDVPERQSDAVRRSVRESLALDKAVRRSSDARKQTAAEMLELRGIMLFGAANDARQAGDRLAEDAALADVRSWIRELFRIDIRAAKLTRGGLVAP